MQKTFETPHPTSLYVELGSGAVTVHTDDVATTTVDVNGRNAEDTIVEMRGDTIVVLAPQRRSGFLRGSDELDVHVSLPHESRLGTKLGSADLTVVGRVGETMVKCGSGEVRIEEVVDEALVETGSGDIELGTMRGDLRIKSGSGDVEIRALEGSGTISTGSGDVEIGRAAQTLQVKSGSGDLVVDEALEGLSLTTASGDLAVRRMHRGELTASNVSGDIQVGIPAGVPVWTDISTLTGSVTSTLQGAGQPEDGQDYIEVRAKTVSGDIHLIER